MEIKTKFAINDTVYTFNYRDSKNWEIIEEKIEKISVMIYENNFYQISYYLKGQNGLVCYPENGLFETRAEAQAECDKRNKGE